MFFSLVIRALKLPRTY
jgi:hypothetical protein